MSTQSTHPARIIDRVRGFLHASPLIIALAASSAMSADTDEDLLYVLQPDHVSVQQLTDAAVDWLILEPTVDGSMSTSFSAAEIEQIKSQGPCPKKILAYLSIGEAENYRDYFDPAWLDANDNPAPGIAPAWLGPTNPDWEGNYKVRYWMPEWQTLIIGTDARPHTTPFDVIIDQGFDGVYLDIIDAYYFWSSPDGILERPRMQARDEMIAFVESLAHHARVVRNKPGFMVFPQGGADIIRDDDDLFDTRTDSYFAVINGIGREDIWYDELSIQQPAETSFTLDQLREYASRGKSVLATDYVIDRSSPTPEVNTTRAADFFSQARAEGFVPYAGYNDRALDAIVEFCTPLWTADQPVPGCPNCDADLAKPFGGVLNLQDVFAYLALFNSQSPAADLAEPQGTFNLQDIFAYLDLFNAGCS